MRIPAILVVLAALGMASAHAQANPYHTGVAAAAALHPASPALASAWTRPQHARLLAASRFSSRAPGATLMIIGGAGVVAGILVGGSGGTVLILGGVAVGAYGVYLYTR